MSDDQLADLWPHSAVLMFYGSHKKKVAEIKVRGKDMGDLKGRIKQMVKEMQETYGYEYKEGA